MAEPITQPGKQKKVDRKAPERLPMDPGVQTLGMIMRKFANLNASEIAFVLAGLNARFNSRNGQ